MHHERFVGIQLVMTSIPRKCKLSHSLSNSQLSIFWALTQKGCSSKFCSLPLVSTLWDMSSGLCTLYLSCNVSLSFCWISLFDLCPCVVLLPFLPFMYYMKQSSTRTFCTLAHMSAWRLGSQLVALSGKVMGPYGCSFTESILSPGASFDTL